MKNTNNNDFMDVLTKNDKIQLAEEKIKKYIKNRWLQNFDEIWCIIFQCSIISNKINQKLQLF